MTDIALALEEMSHSTKVLWMLQGYYAFSFIWSQDFMQYFTTATSLP